MKKSFRVHHKDHNRSFDHFLKNHPGENTVYSLTSSNNGLESTNTISSATVGFSSTGIIIAGLIFTFQAAAATAANAAILAADAAAQIASVIGIEVNVAVPGAGIILTVLAFIGIWIAYSIGRNIILNLIYENRSSKTLTLVDFAAYNIGSRPIKDRILKPLSEVTIGTPPVTFDFYDDVVIDLTNYSKYKGVGVSLKFQKPDKTNLIVCIRNDIHKDPHYGISVVDDETAESFYENCTGSEDDRNFKDYAWGDDIVVKNNLDSEGWKSYNFNGIISFHDKV